MSESRADQRSRPPKRRLTLGLAVLMAVVALVVGLVAGYVARGGPPDRILVTTQQELPVVTVTTETPTP